MIRNQFVDILDCGRDAVDALCVNFQNIYLQVLIDMNSLLHEKNFLPSNNIGIHELGCKGIFVISFGTHQPLKFPTRLKIFLV